MVLVVAVVATVVAIGTYLTWIAGRLDRLTIRVEAARASLDAQLVRRAAAAQALSALTTPARDRPGPALAALADAAANALAAPPDAREGAESALTRALSAALTGPDDSVGSVGGVGSVGAGRGRDDLHRAAEAAGTRVQLARQLHNDAVHGALALRRRRLVRWLRLYGHARPPAYFEIDDALR